jgi:hypothetical protein
LTNMFKLWTNARAEAIRVPLFVSSVRISELLDLPDTRLG